jgi:CRP/FNR family cyclic AMP-dependent transcriptional regulator
LGGYDVRMSPSKAAPHNDETVHPALPASLQALTQGCLARTYRKGTLLIQEGDVGDTIYVILEGRLRTFGSDPASEREITYGHYGPGDFVGEMGLDGGPRSASVMATEKTLCSVVPRARLVEHVRQQPEFAFELITSLIRRARAATEAAKQMALTDVYGRLRKLLGSMAEPMSDGTRLVPGPLTHKDIAQRLGCTREMVSRLTKDLETGGYIERAGRGWRLLQSLPTRY